MDDILPLDAHSPEIIHVVSYSEATELATPPIVDESIRITRAALDFNRERRNSGTLWDVDANTDVAMLTEQMVWEARRMLSSMEVAIPNLYTAQGFELALRAGYFSLPGLWGQRETYHRAADQRTKLVGGSMVVVDSSGLVVPVDRRIHDVESWNASNRLE
jgi:hypothetical protein